MLGPAPQPEELVLENGITVTGLSLLIVPFYFESVARDDTNIICIQCHSWWGGGRACRTWFSPQEPPTANSRVKKYTNSVFEALQEIFSC